jgi:hypothetical protein
MTETQGRLDLLREIAIPEVQERDGEIFLGDKHLYNPEKLTDRNPFLESISPLVINRANTFVQEQPDLMYHVRKCIRQMGINTKLIRIPTGEEINIT